VLIINLKSGGGKAERFDLAAQARRWGIEPVVLQPGDDLLELAESAIARGAQVIGMAGGDGSQALVATAAARHDIAHVCIPVVTRNHFVLDLGLDRDDVVGALDAFADGVERRVDLARINDRVFVNNASLGVYAKVVQSDAYRDAERIDTGLLGVLAARVRSAADVSKLLALELVGQAGRFPGLLSWSTQKFEISSAGPVDVRLDGEALVLDPPLRFASLPGALRVRLPSGVGLPPAARAAALTMDNLGALLRVAASR
jgi:diacylglycerol kinase family enzyme